MLTYIREKFHPLWRLRQSPTFRRIQQKCDPDVTCRIEGIRVSVKLLRDASVILAHKGKEVESRNSFIEILNKQKIQTFFDIGANIGSYSWAALAHGVDEVFLFEPDETNQRLLSKTIRKNDLARCYLVTFAVGETVGVAEFLIDHASGATGSLENHTKNISSLHYAYGMADTRTVPTLNLDIFAEYARSKRVMVKIDVEGAEVGVFKGGRKFFQQVYPFVLVECFERGRLRFFEEIGYSIHPLPENHNYLLSPPSLSLSATTAR